MRRSYGWKAPRGACLWVNPHMAGTCLPKPVLLRISIARFVSESSHIGTRTIPNRRRGVVVPPRLRANLANSPLVDSLPLIRISH